MSFEIVYGDITTMKVDAIVNAANEWLKQGGGVCGAIFKKAGAKELQDECDKIGYCPCGDAVLTKGYNMSKYIIHTVGPRYVDGNHGERKLLENCYKNSLELAKKNNIKSIAFPLISSGIFGYPVDEALEVAKETIEKYKGDLDVYLVLFRK